LKGKAKAYTEYRKTTLKAHSGKTTQKTHGNQPDFQFLIRKIILFNVVPAYRSSFRLDFKKPLLRTLFLYKILRENPLF